MWTQLCVPELVAPKSTFRLWKWSDADWDHLKLDLLDQEQGGQRDWITALGEPKTVSEAVDFLQQQIVHSQMLYVPHKDVTHRGIQCPWLNKPIRRLIERKNAQFR